MDSTTVSTIQSPRLTLTASWILVSCLILFGGDPTAQFGFQPKLITRFCYNSPNLSTVNSQCVLCNYFMFDATVLGCTGSTALTMNITSTQAFCVISQCLGQVRQSPVFLGRRRKRDSGNDGEEEDVEWIELTNSSRKTGTKYRIANEVMADVYDDDEEDEDPDNEIFVENKD